MDSKTRPPTTEEKLGRIWGWVYVSIIVLLTTMLFAKGCFFSDY